MSRRLGVLAAAAAALALLATACGGKPPVKVEAVFDDVAGLNQLASVKVADVTVGHVSNVSRTDDLQALVTMEIRAGTDLPSEVSARLRKTSLLGERYVEIVPQSDSGSLVSGTRITDTTVLPDLEKVLTDGTELLAAVAADTLAQSVRAGSVALEGRGQTLSGVLTDVEKITSAYNDRSEDVTAVIDRLEAFTDDLAPTAELQGRALEELRRAARTLREEDTQLLDTLQEVRDLSNTGTDLLATNRDRLATLLDSLNGLTAELVERDPDVARLFGLVTKHNNLTIQGVNKENIQIIADIIICGYNSEAGDPIRACDEVPQGIDRPPAAPKQ
jgi:phospholipid/cholesterol/gamma-HCH transport system substrate-binding protein